MFWINVIVLLVLFLSVIGGMKDGAAKTFFSMASTIIAIPLTGHFYLRIARLLSFLPDGNWQNFIAFHITLAIIVVILTLIFLIPRKIISAIWNGGCLFRVIGGALNLTNAAIGLVVFALVLQAYPIFNWLQQWVNNSGIIVWLVGRLGFVGGMLPGLFRTSWTW